MTEQEPGAPVETGHRGVDDVLGSLEQLEDRPVGEHVEIFENVHEQLRRILAEAGEEEA